MSSNFDYNAIISGRYFDNDNDNEQKYEKKVCCRENYKCVPKPDECCKIVYSYTCPQNNKCEFNEGHNVCGAQCQIKYTQSIYNNTEYPDQYFYIKNSREKCCYKYANVTQNVVKLPINGSKSVYIQKYRMDIPVTDKLDLTCYKPVCSNVNEGVCNNVCNNVCSN